MIYLSVVIFIKDEKLHVAIADSMMPVISLLSAIALFYGAKRSVTYSKRLYVAWAILGLAYLSWALADVTWMVYEVILLQEPFPSLADVFYLAYYPLFFLGIFYLPAKPLKRDEWIKMGLDTSIIMLAAFLVFWNFLIGPILAAGTNETLLTSLLSAAYPVFDLILLWALLMIIFRRPEVKIQGPLMLLAWSAMVMILTDSVFGYQSVLGIYESGGLTSFGYVVSLVLAGLAGILQAVPIQSSDSEELESSSKSESTDRLISWPLYLPYIWMIIPFFMLIWSHYYTLNIEFPTLAFFVVAITGSAIIRQILTLNENKLLYNTVQRARDELEIRVHQRTAELENANKDLKAEIVERGRIEEELKLKAKLLDGATDSIMLHDFDGNAIYLNETAYKSRGYTENEMLNINLRDLEPPEYAKLIKPRIEELIVKGENIFESATFCKDGSIMPTEVHAQIIESGGRKLIFGSARNITERKKAETELKKYQEHLEELVEERTAKLKKINEELLKEIKVRTEVEKALKESENRYRTIFENTGTATLIIEKDTTISLVNSKAEALFGYPREDIEGKKSWTELVAKDDLDKMKEYHHLRRIGSDAAPKTYESKLIDFRGNVKNILLNIAMIPGTKKSLVSLLDITEHKEAEEKIRKSLEEKELLLREIHHRVKNNMQIISSLLNLQSEHVKDKEALDVFKESQNRVRSMAMIHETLYRSKDLLSIDFRKYIESLVSGLFVSYGIDPKLIKIQINVEDVLLNIDTAIPCGLFINELLTNSLKHAFPHGREGKISIDLHSVDDRFIFTINDNGIGFPEDLDFKNTDTLGLQLVNHLVNQVDGTIELDRSHGIKFTIVFKELEYEKRI